MSFSKAGAGARGWSGRLKKFKIQTANGKWETV
jgi:hypothetical protein